MGIRMETRILLIPVIFGIFPIDLTTEATSATTAPSGARSSALGLRLGLLLLLLHQQSIQVQGIGQNVVANVATTNGERIEVDWVLALDGHLDLLQVSVHTDVDSSDGAHNDGSILQLNGDGFRGKPHQKFDQFHHLCYEFT